MDVLGIVVSFFVLMYALGPLKLDPRIRVVISLIGALLLFPAVYVFVVTAAYNLGGYPYLYWVLLVLCCVFCFLLGMWYMHRRQPW